MNGVPKESIHLELLRALACPERPVAHTPQLAKALGTSAQFVVAKLRPLVSAGLVVRETTRGSRSYSLSDEGREYLRRSEGRTAR